VMTADSRPFKVIIGLQIIGSTFKVQGTRFKVQGTKWKV